MARTDSRQEKHQHNRNEGYEFEQSDPMRVIIVGAGIGGLAAAVALHKTGVEALVIERTPSIREVGAGLSLWSNAVNALRELGLDAKVIAAGSLIERSLVQTPKGRVISRTELGDVIRMAGSPCICIHRAVLQKILLDALPPHLVRTDARCVGLDGSTVILENGEHIQADVLVGADGISSVIRDGLHGAEAPRYAGYTAWRGICEDNGFLPERSALLVMGGGSQFGGVPCGPGRLYWFLTKNAPRGTTQSKKEVDSVCRDWAAPVPEIVAGTPQHAILQNDIIDRPPLQWWGRGMVTLLGDAAHPTTPNLGQAACQALEDAVILAHCLSETHPVEVALRKYEGLRLPRTTEVDRNSWQTGKVIQLDSPRLEQLRNWFMGTGVSRRLEQRTFSRLLTYQLPRLRSRAQIPSVQMNSW